jgi:hypothetical protein
MINQLLTLDPRLPLVWQTPHTLQIGFDPPRVVLENLDSRLLPILSEIHKGISDTGVWMLARKSRIPDSLVDAFLTRLEPALADSTPPHIPNFTLAGTPALTRYASEVLHGVGAAVSHADHSKPTPQGDVLFYSHFVPNPQHFHLWLREDRPHTPVIFTDQAVVIGPRIIPGVTRCLRCHFVGDRDTHPHWLALASQLWGKAAASATPEFVRLATWYALQLLERDEANLQYRLTVDTRALRVTTSVGAGECSCLDVG